MTSPSFFDPVKRLTQELLALQKKNMELLELMQEGIDGAEEEWGEDDEWCMKVREELKALQPRTPKANDLDAPPESC